MTNVPQSPIAVRDARPEDAAVITEFNCALALESEHLRLDAIVVRRGVDHVLTRPHIARYFVAERDGRIVGQAMITCEWSDWRAAFFWWIQSVYVPPEARRQGVFKAVLRHIQNTARSAPDVCGLRLYVENQNHRAIRTYENLGFALTGHLLYGLEWSPPTGRAGA